MGWNPHGSGPFSKHVVYGPVSASASSTFTTGEVYCFGAKAVHFIIHSPSNVQATIAAVTQYGLGGSSGLSNTYNPWQTMRSFNPSGTSSNMPLGWVFSILPGNFAGSSIDSAPQRRMWFERATASYTLAAGANATDVKVTSIVEWED